jgi:hypothetical protein
MNKLKKYILRFERATWHGKTRLFPDVRNAIGVFLGLWRKHAVSLSSGDVNSLQNEAVVDKN